MGLLRVKHLAFAEVYFLFIILIKLLFISSPKVHVIGVDKNLINFYFINISLLLGFIEPS